MAVSNAHKHLTREERHIIETGIRNGSTKSAIASTIGKNKSISVRKSKNVVIALQVLVTVVKSTPLATSINLLIKSHNG